MVKKYLSLKKKILLSLSAFIGFVLPFLGGHSTTNIVSADVPEPNTQTDPCPGPAGCCN